LKFFEGKIDSSLDYMTLCHLSIELHYFFPFFWGFFLPTLKEGWIGSEVADPPPKVKSPPLFENEGAELDGPIKLNALGDPKGIWPKELLVEFGPNVELDPKVEAGVDPKVLVELEPKVLEELGPKVGVGVDPKVLVKLKPKVLEEIEPKVGVGVDPKVLVELEPKVLEELDPKVEELDPKVELDPNAEDVDPKGALEEGLTKVEVPKEPKVDGNEEVVDPKTDPEGVAEVEEVSIEESIVWLSTGLEMEELEKEFKEGFGKEEGSWVTKGLKVVGLFSGWFNLIWDSGFVTEDKEAVISTFVWGSGFEARFSGQQYRQYFSLTEFSLWQEGHFHILVFVEEWGVDSVFGLSSFLFVSDFPNVLSTVVNFLTSVVDWDRKLNPGEVGFFILCCWFRS